MHVGHAALLDWLHAAEVLVEKPRVVMVSSAVMGLGAFDPSILTDPKGEGDLYGAHCFASAPPLLIKACALFPPFFHAELTTFDALHNTGGVVRKPLAVTRNQT
jgi:hypothetical protein